MRDGTLVKPIIKFTALRYAEPLPVPSTPDISPLAADQWVLSWMLSDIQNYSEVVVTLSEVILILSLEVMS